MCFTPIVSLSFAVIEFTLATILIVFFKKTYLRDFFAAIIYVLGSYQFTEFMLCTTSHPILWAKLGFIAYSFLPAIGFHAMVKIFKKKINLFWIYLIPFSASLMAISSSNFIINAQCSRFFVDVFFNEGIGLELIRNLNYWLYMTYYFGFIVLSLFIVIKDFFHQKNKIKKLIDEDIAIGITLMMVPTFILIVVFRFSQIKFPSILCGFAIFVAITAFFAVYLESRKKNFNKVFK